MAEQEKITQLWQKAAKNPPWRPPIFKTPEELWNKALEYFTWCDENPLIEQDFRGKDATEVHLNKMRPYTLSGLNLWLGVNPGFWTDMRDAHKNRNDGFSTIITHIEEAIRNQKFEGAAAGFFNANIIARDLGLADKKDISIEPERSRITELFAPTDDTKNGTDK